jgi:hypothetical protein
VVVVVVVVVDSKRDRMGGKRKSRLGMKGRKSRLRLTFLSKP